MHTDKQYFFKFISGRLICLSSYFLFFFFFLVSQAHALVHVVAAENIYGEIASELGGPYVRVKSILNNPNEDPHLFTTTPSTAIAVSHADIVIYNGANYDPWMASILSIAGQKQQRIVLNVASLLHVSSGANPHLWYLPTMAPVFAKAFVHILAQLDPEHKAYFEKQWVHFIEQDQIIFKTVAELRQRFKNTPVIATEPIFADMADSIGLQMHGKTLQMNIMNDVAPSIAEVKAFEDDLSHHAVRVLIYNNQVINPLTEHLKSLAKKDNIPVVGVSELIPPGLTYVDWMMRELTALKKALESTTHE